MSNHVILIDGSGFVFRAYHALPPLSRPGDNLPVGAVHGFCNMLWKLLREANDLAPPTHIAVIFDHSAVTFRNQISATYKANRPELPRDLAVQFPLVREAVRAFNVACVEQKGYEADDLIATYARQAVEACAFVTVVSSDKDLMQIVSDHVRMYDTMKEKVIGRREVLERFGVSPERVGDVLALTGDVTDNVPGVPGVGIKKAAKLISEFGDLENVLELAHTVAQPALRQSLMANVEQARLSRRLVELDSNVPLDVPLSECAVRPIDKPKLTSFLRQMGFHKLPARIEEAL